MMADALRSNLEDSRLLGLPPAALQASPGGEPGPQPSDGGQNQQPKPAPTHEQAVAALRHFHALEGEFTKLSQNPNLGKGSIKAAIIDMATRLVSQRIVQPKDAVTMLATVPEDPLAQRKWITNQLVHNQVAPNVVLDHHRKAFQGSQDWSIEGPRMTSNPDEHMNDMGSLMSHYKGRKV